jgi:hypothetical protein
MKCKNSTNEQVKNHISIHTTITILVFTDKLIFPPLDIEHPDDIELQLLAKTENIPSCSRSVLVTEL